MGLGPGLVSCLTEIKSIPATAAMRPSRQQGGSIIGFDQLDFVRNVFESGVAVSFPFQHSSRSPEIVVSRDDLVPNGDPFERVVRSIGQIERERELSS
jgi:hypothetical protein